MNNNYSERNFSDWLSTFKHSISTYDYYTNFEKVYGNVDKIKVELHILNSLIGSKNISEDFINLVDQYPEILKCIPILLAVRIYEIFAMDVDGDITYSFNKPNQSAEQYCVFMKRTGLFQLMEEKIVNNLYDYILGVEVGLDTNARKNRGGHLMEDLNEEYILKTKEESEFILEVYKEMKTSIIE